MREFGYFHSLIMFIEIREQIEMKYKAGILFIGNVGERAVEASIVYVLSIQYYVVFAPVFCILGN